PDQQRAGLPRRVQGCAGRRRPPHHRGHEDRRRQRHPERRGRRAGPGADRAQPAGPARRPGRRRGRRRRRARGGCRVAPRPRDTRGAPLDRRAGRLAFAPVARRNVSPSSGRRYISAVPEPLAVPSPGSSPRCASAPRHRARGGLGVLALAALVALVTAACGGEPERTFVVGAGDSTESLVLAEIYAGALARTGQPVRVHPGLGPRRDYLAALDEGTIDLVGEQTGELLAALDSTAEARTPDEVVTALYRALPADLTLADPADGADMRPRVLVTEQRAQAENLTTVEDLLPRCPETTAAQASAP